MDERNAVARSDPFAFRKKHVLVRSEGDHWAEREVVGKKLKIVVDWDFVVGNNLLSQYAWIVLLLDSDGIAWWRKFLREKLEIARSSYDLKKE